jgi:multidrug efflux system outer membrane protein
VKANVDVAEARHAEVRRQYELAVLEATEDVETSIVVYNTARQRLGHLEDAAAASENANELARIRFEAGATDFLEVLDSERRLLEAQDALATGRLETAAALVGVFRASGGVWPGAADRAGED